MPRLSVQSLNDMRDRLQAERLGREGKCQATVVVHMGTCGISAGARRVMTALLGALEERGIADVAVSSSGCAGMCSREPMATVQRPGEAPVKYADLDEKKIVRVLDEHVLGGVIVKEFALAMGSERAG
jgi:NADP-reducing hydrogenase subunit HndB